MELIAHEKNQNDNFNEVSLTVVTCKIGKFEELFQARISPRLTTPDIVEYDMQVVAISKAEMRHVKTVFKSTTREEWHAGTDVKARLRTYAQLYIEQKYGEKLVFRLPKLSPSDPQTRNMFNGLSVSVD